MYYYRGDASRSITIITVKDIVCYNNIILQFTISTTEHIAHNMIIAYMQEVGAGGYKQSQSYKEE